MTTDSIVDTHARWLPVSDAAAVLGVSDEILRLRMSRQAIGSRVDADGRVFVRTPYDLTDYIRAGVTAPAAPDETAGNNGAKQPDTPDHASLGAAREPAPTAPARGPIDPLLALNEARVADLKHTHAAQIADLKSVIVDMTERHNAEVERLMDSHQAEMQRIVDLHNITTKMLHEQARHTAKIEAEAKTVLIDVISALNGQK